MTNLYEKYKANWCSMMGTYTFNKKEVTREVIKDFKGWNVQSYMGEVTYYKN